MPDAALASPPDPLTLLLLLLLGPGALALGWLWRPFAPRSRRRALLRAHGDPAVVEAILRRRPRRGMTAAQLREAWGEPAAAGRRRRGARVIETLDYPRAGSRPPTRVTLEDGRVTGWHRHGGPG